MRRCRLRWHGHVERKEDMGWQLGASTKLVVKGASPVSRLKKSWQNYVSADMHLLGGDLACPGPSKREDSRSLSVCGTLP